ncbi:MAG: hypothetical protein HN731_03255 [Rhodospirillaceae bacterium]|nr:hypothetical protein [Rhodospirillaceae bacterium]MBT7954180.1 hypothetical protein [Rhodospirillaceae bacterium]
MTPSTKKQVKWGSTIFTLLWILAVGVDQFGDFGTFDYGSSVREEQLQEQLNECRGSFKVRYNCKSAILRSHGRDNINYWGSKIGWTFGPALLIYIVFNLWLRRVEWNEEKERRRLRLIRMEKKRQKKSRAASEEGRQRTIAAQRRQSIKKAEKDSMRVEMDRPLNVLVVTQDDLLIDKMTPRYFAQGYHIIGSDLRDVFLSFKEIGYHIVLIENKFTEPELHPEDAKDPDFPGLPLPVATTISKMRERKDNIRVVSWAQEYEGLSESELAEKATALGADVAISKSSEIEDMVDLFISLLARKSTPDPDIYEEDEEDDDY